ncbi:acyltransferase [Metabacillus fastidiosus]|uniref:acyltransferase n=1 Tax=Metabacillus fastidiosus TaxID=1458 RepID=UPI003D2D7020
MDRSRIIYFDNLRIIATFGVILLHSAAPILYKFGSVTDITWWTGNVYDSFMRWCVPVFFMISGALLLKPAKVEKPSIFVKKRVSKVIIPFIAWSIFYLIIQINDEMIENDPFLILKAFLEGKIYYHLWFLYVIIAIYLILPVLRVYFATATRRNIEYYLILCLIVTSGFSLIAKFYEIKIDINVEAASGYIGYFLLGYYLHNYELPKFARGIIYLLAAIAMFVIIRGTYFLTLENEGILDGYFYHYLNMPAVITSMAVFLIFKHITFDLCKFSVFALINRASLGIYLVHPYIFLLLLENYDIHGHTVRAWAGIPLLSAFTLVVSLIIVLILQKIPLIKKIVP